MTRRSESQEFIQEFIDNMSKEQRARMETGLFAIGEPVMVDDVEAKVKGYGIVKSLDEQWQVEVELDSGEIISTDENNVNPLIDPETDF